MKQALPVRRARLFRTIWRVNGLYLFAIGTVAAVSAVFALLVGLITLLQGALPDNSGVPVIAEQKAEPDRTPVKWTLNDSEVVRGTPWRMLAQSQGERQERGSLALSSYDSYAGMTRNYLFLNATNLERHFLLPDSNAIFLNTERLGESTASSKKPVRWIEYRLVRTDTNKDDRLSNTDLQEIGFSDAAGRQFSICLSGVEEVLGEDLVNPDTRLILYRKQGRNYAALLDLKTHQVARQETLPTSPISSSQD